MVRSTFLEDVVFNFRVKHTKIAFGEKGAKQAAANNGVAVIIDVFRATTTMLTLLGKGVHEIIVTDSIEFARSLEATHLLVGERMGPIKGFEFANSPVQISKCSQLRCTKAVHTTTNGTRVLLAARGAAAVFTCSFGNVSHIASILKAREEDVYVVPAGHLEGSNFAEDDLCAEALLSLLQGDPLPFKDNAVNAFAQRDPLREFPLAHEREFCLTLDQFSIAPFVAEWGDDYAKVVNWTAPKH